VFAAVLPTSRSVQIGIPATVFATIVNAGPTTARDCGIALATPIPASFSYQMTDPQTNVPVGSSPYTAATIPPNAAQPFVVVLTPRAPFAPTDVAMNFHCANAASAPVRSGLTTVLLSASLTSVPDIIALSATTSGDGVLSLPGVGGAAAFATATVNVGAAGTLTVSANTGDRALPLFAGVCETDPASGNCLAPPGASLTRVIGAGETPTFALFVIAQGPIPFAPDVNRIFVEFVDGTGARRGSTSVAVRTLGP
jgi:hypothetical protein